MRNDSFHHVRQNDDNWCAYALAKYVQDKVGVYPILPLADGCVYSDNALFNRSSTQRFDGKNHEALEMVCLSDSDYPPWYIEARQRARRGDFGVSTGPSSAVAAKLEKEL